MLDLVEEVLSTFGFAKYEVNLSTRPEKSVGDEQFWKVAENALTEALGSESRVVWWGGTCTGPLADGRGGRTWRLEGTSSHAPAYPLHLPCVPLASALPSPQCVPLPPPPFPTPLHPRPHNPTTISTSSNRQGLELRGGRGRRSLLRSQD